MFVYEIDGIEIEKSVFMVHGENTTVVQYAASAPCALELRPLIAFRDYHATTHENGAIDPSIAIEPGLVTCAPYRGLPKLRPGAHHGRSAADRGLVSQLRVRG